MMTICGALVVPTGWLPKSTLIGERPTNVPTPINETVCGLSIALSVTLMVPVIVPNACGLKNTRLVQFAPTGRLDGQVFV